MATTEDVQVFTVENFKDVEKCLKFYHGETCDIKVCVEESNFFEEEVPLYITKYLRFSGNSERQLNIFSKTTRQIEDVVEKGTVFSNQLLNLESETLTFLFDVAKKYCSNLVFCGNKSLSRTSACFSEKVSHPAKGHVHTCSEGFKETVMKLCGLENHAKQCVQIEMDFFNDVGKIGPHRERMCRSDKKRGLFFIILENPERSENVEENEEPAKKKRKVQEGTVEEELAKKKRKGSENVEEEPARKKRNVQKYISFQSSGDANDKISQTSGKAVVTQNCLVRMAGYKTPHFRIGMKLPNMLLITVQLIHDDICPEKIIVVKEKKERKKRAPNSVKKGKIYLKTTKKKTGSCVICTTCFPDRVTIPCGHNSCCKTCFRKWNEIAKERGVALQMCVTCRTPVWYARTLIWTKVDGEEKCLECKRQYANFDCHFIGRNPNEAGPACSDCILIHDHRQRLFLSN